MKIIVNPHKCEIDKTPVNEKEINITKCQFEFADEITDEFVKEAYFTLGKGTTYKQIIVNNECDIPGEVLEKQGTIEIGVVAKLVENENEIKRYNPSPAYFPSWQGSLKDAENSQPITPSEFDQYEQALQDGLSEVNQKISDIDEALIDVNDAITETNNLDLDVSKSGKVATITLTKKDATTKAVTLSDGTNLMFNWDGTRLGIKTDEDAEYTYVDLQGVQGPIGPKGEAFTIKKTYSSIEAMNADFNNMQLGDYVMIASTVEVEDNAKLYTRGESQWIFISDFSGAQGIRGETGLTPNIQIGTVVSGVTPSVTRTGTNENPILNFVLEKGETGNTGPTGPTGNGIASITKTGTSGKIDTYTITYTNGTTTTFTVTNGEITQEIFDGLVVRVEDLETNQISKEEEGTTIHVEDADSVRLNSFELIKESTQEGTPSPSNPQEITTITGSVDVYISNGTITSTYTIPLNNNEIAGIGDYLDELLVDKDGKVWLNKKIGKVVLNGSESGWSTPNSISYSLNKNSYFPNNNIPAYNTTNYKCSHFAIVAYQDAATIGKAWAGGSYVNFNYDGTNQNMNNFKNWLSTNNITVYYVLATPQLIDLNTTVDLRLFKGTNNISNSEDASMKINYVVDINNILNNKQDKLVSGTNIKTINNQSLLGSGNINIGGGGGSSIDVQINGTSIVSGDVANIETKGTYNASSNKIVTESDLPTIPTNISAFTNDAGYLTQHQDISGKLDTSKVKTTTSTTSGDVYDVTYINTMLGDIESLLGGI